MRSLQQILLFQAVCRVIAFPVRAVVVKKLVGQGAVVYFAPLVGICQVAVQALGHVVNGLVFAAAVSADVQKDAAVFPFFAAAVINPVERFDKALPEIITAVGSQARDGNDQNILRPLFKGSNLPQGAFIAKGVLCPLFGQYSISFGFFAAVGNVFSDASSARCFCCLH